MTPMAVGIKSCLLLLPPSPLLLLLLLLLLLFAVAAVTAVTAVAAAAGFGQACGPHSARELDALQPAIAGYGEAWEGGGAR